MQSEWKSNTAEKLEVLLGSIPTPVGSEEYERRRSDIRRAILMAETAHRDQIDRDEKPHFDHCFRVAMRQRSLPRVVAALLHDTVEDTQVTLTQIELAFDPYVRELVDAMSRRKDESWRIYIDRIVSTGLDAVLLKVSDIEDNLARADAKMLNKKKMYEDALIKLRAAIPPY